MNNIKLQRVHHMQVKLESGILYVSEEFEIAAHLCACGCGNKIVTPLGPTDWSFKVEKGKPTLYPSIGNWQLPCQSHYWIRKGKIEWSYQWSKEQIESGRKREMELRKSHYEKKPEAPRSFWRKLINWLLNK
jgi:hypothetical protein